MSSQSEKLARRRARAIDADHRARHAIAQLADEILGSAPACRRMIVYLLGVRMEDASLRGFGRDVGVHPTTILTRLSRASAPSFRRLAAMVTCVRLASMLEHPDVSISVAAETLGASSHGALHRYFRVIYGTAIRRWRLRTTGANELQKLKTFLRIHARHYEAVTLAGAAVPIALSLPSPVCARCGGEVRAA